MASRLHQTMGVHANLASDGFFVNLCWVMLHLSSPFMTYEDVSPRKHKMGAIDVKYCALTSTNIVDGDEICRVDFSGEARLIPGAEAMSGIQIMLIKCDQHYNVLDAIKAEQAS